MDFITLTIEVLKGLSLVCGGNWGLAIILLTVIVRMILWPLNVSQQRSMKKMQTLQPRLKAIQDRYKSQPEVMQKKMMEFYQEHKFNPMAGCLPLLLQLPIFILLYSALMSPQFIEIAGDAKFLFINRLDATIKGSAGKSFDGSFGASKYDTFASAKTVTVFLGDEQIDNVKVQNPQKAVVVMGELVSGEPVDLKINLDNLNLKFSQLEKITKADVKVTDVATKEVENIEFKRDGSILTASVPTVKIQNAIHYDVIFLVALFCLTMWLSQKIMMATTSTQSLDPTQAAMQKSMGTIMPIMIGATFVFIPIPAGVLLYLIASNIIQILQTYTINKQLEKEEEVKKSELNLSTDLKNAKKIEAKEVKNIKE